MKIGDILVKNDGYLTSGCFVYTHAILVSLSPFVMVSEGGDMLWSCEKPKNFHVIGVGSEEETRAAFARWDRSKKEYGVITTEDESNLSSYQKQQKHYAEQFEQWWKLYWKPNSGVLPVMEASFKEVARAAWDASSTCTYNYIDEQGS